MAQDQTLNMKEIPRADAERMLILSNGNFCEMFSYSSTRSMLVLRVDSKPNNLFIVCGGCDYYKGPTAWHNNRITVRQEKDAYILEDKDVDLLVKCCDWRLQIRER